MVKVAKASGPHLADFTVSRSASLLLLIRDLLNTQTIN